MANLKMAGLIAVTALALAGCGGPSGMWSKNGVTQNQSTQDQRGCLHESDSYAFLDGNTGPANLLGSGGGQAGTNSRNELYRMCMNSRGYARVAEPDAE